MRKTQTLDSLGSQSIASCILDGYPAGWSNMAVQSPQSSAICLHLNTNLWGISQLAMFEDTGEYSLILSLEYPIHIESPHYTPSCVGEAQISDLDHFESTCFMFFFHV